MAAGITFVFDLDGTLVDTAADLAAALNHALGVLDRPPVPAESVRAMVGEGARALLRRGLGASGPADEALVEAGVGPFLAFYAANIAVHSRPFPHAEALLERLALAGGRLAICTNKPEALARTLLAAFGWQQRFQALLGADTLPVRKPDPLHLLQTIARAGGRPGASVFTGDSLTDARTADAAGIPLILVRHGYSTVPVDSLGADAVIDGFHQFEAALAQVQRRFNAPAR